MKWFKHLSGSLNNSFIFELIEKFGGDGYLVFFGTLEIMADEFDIFNPGVNCVSIKKMTKSFQLSRQKTIRILRFCNQIAIENSPKNVSFFANIEDSHVTIKCKRLAELCDEHTRKLLKKNQESNRSESGKNPAQEVEVEAEVDIKDLPKGKRPSDPKEKKLFKLPSKEEISEASILKLNEDLNKITEELYETKIFPDVHSFKNKMIKEGKNLRSIIHTLTRCYLKEDFENDTPWGYCARIISIENGNYNERDHNKTAR